MNEQESLKAGEYKDLQKKALEMELNDAEIARQRAEAAREQTQGLQAGGMTSFDKSKLEPSVAESLTKLEERADVANAMKKLSEQSNLPFSDKDVWGATGESKSAGTLQDIIQESIKAQGKPAKQYKIDTLDESGKPITKLVGGEELEKGFPKPPPPPLQLPPSVPLNLDFKEKNVGYDRAKDDLVQAKKDIDAQAKDDIDYYTATSEKKTEYLGFGKEQTSASKKEFADKIKAIKEKAKKDKQVLQEEFDRIYKGKTPSNTTKGKKPISQSTYNSLIKQGYSPAEINSKYTVQ